MFGFLRGLFSGDAQATVAALDRSQAVIEFALDGTILTANQRFLDLFGYSLAEVRGKHHSMFIEPGVRDSPAYTSFWDALRRGEVQAAQFKRIGKGGREVWIEASYNPLLGRDGKPYKVVKYATDVTAQKAEYADLRGQVAAINLAQAVVEFSLDGTILSANEKFLNLLGYSLDEVRGKHHGMFVEPAYRSSADYRRFWEHLRAGEYQAAQFKRIGKGGKVAWIEASYNPIRDLNGKPFKVVKYATDITLQADLLANLKMLLDRNFGNIDTAIARSDDKAGLAAAAVHKTSADVQQMAASAEELAASVHEISSMMAKSTAATDSARTRASAADQAIRRLANSSASMENVVGLIRSIAGQINLLALNATIESARAGDAGKGFAVVAGEVKNLAQQAANATNQIAQEIAELQAVSAEVVQGLTDIMRSIEALAEYVGATAAAVEEQSAVTQSLSASMQSTAGTVQAINDNMSDITTSVRQVAEVVNDTRGAAQVLVPKTGS